MRFYRDNGEDNGSYCIIVGYYEVCLLLETCGIRQSRYYKGRKIFSNFILILFEVPPYYSCKSNLGPPSWCPAQAST